MPSLIQSDLWRDGGSLSATVLDGSKEISFWLQTNDWNHPEQAGHEHLFISNGTDAEAKESRIPISSIEEAHWLDYLVVVDDFRVDDESRGYFRKIVEVLKKRQKTK
jgi:hypothetical protein